MEKIISKDDLYKFLDSVLKDFEVIAPKESPNRGIFYEKIESVQDLYLGENFTVLPAKKFFLSPWEWLFKSQGQGDKNSLEEIPLAKEKRVILGLRPCEAKGLKLLDKVYDAEYKDEFYLNNRKRTLIIGLACSAPDKSCFCTSLGGSNIESQGMDALLYNLDGKFILEAVTEQGKDFFGRLGSKLSPEEKKHWHKEQEEIKNRVKSKIKVSDSLAQIFASPYWGKISRPCLSCGICTFLCPTCHCFDLVDEERKKLRCYDGCAFSDFTLEASGVNPRLTKEKRYRQRVFHKFSYFKKNFGEHLCIGCGRCIRHCPVKMDISEIVDKAPV